MTASDIQEAILRDRWVSNHCVPNYTHEGWFECDIFVVTKSGYTMEFEVKINRSDFFADADKERVKRPTAWINRPDDGKIQFLTEKKHDLIAAAHTSGPSRFWYATPQGLIKPEEIPVWAGLVEFHRVREQDSLTMREIKQAPLLHREKCKQAVKDHSIGVCYYRMHNQRVVIRQLNREIERLRTQHSRVDTEPLSGRHTSGAVENGSSVPGKSGQGTVN